ncbi:MAG TPA: hypothetical protein IAB43_04580 [Candidatus Spyradocola merdavium]|nr:hypothetical protein [Candidatus Spyradocola merdavium]
MFHGRCTSLLRSARMFRETGDFLALLSHSGKRNAILFTTLKHPPGNPPGAPIFLSETKKTILQANEIAAGKTSRRARGQAFLAQTGKCKPAKKSPAAKILCKTKQEKAALG